MSDLINRLEAKRRGITLRAQADGRTHLTEAETEEFRMYSERIDELSEDMQRSGRFSHTATAIRRAMAHGSSGGSQPLSPLFPSLESLDRLEEARRDGTSVSLMEKRAAIATTDMGTATEYSSNGIRAPRTLWRTANIPTSEPAEGYAGTVPLVTLPSAVSLVAEGSPHAEFDAVAPDNVQLRRAGAWSDLTAEALISSTMAEVSQAHAQIIARNIDKATCAKLESGVGISTYSIDEALQLVSAETSAPVDSLWIVGSPTDIATLVGTATAMAPTNGADVGSWATRYAGAQLYSSAAASTGQLTVLDPQGFRVFATRLGSAVVVDPTTGTQRFGSWLHFGIVQTLAGAVCEVSDLT